LDAGAYSAITVQSWRNMTPQIAAKLVKEHGSERIMIDSDCGGGPSDPLAVAKTAMELRRIGVGEKDIDKVCYFNGRQFYGLTD
jgi:predicted metal-dependent TIM-barrel fold hydrolase